MTSGPRGARVRIRRNTLANPAATWAASAAWMASKSRMKTQTEIETELDRCKRKLAQWTENPHEDPEIQRRLIAGHEATIQAYNWVLLPSHI